jgi:hypothetical protein
MKVLQAVSSGFYSRKEEVIESCFRLFVLITDNLKENQEMIKQSLKWFLQSTEFPPSPKKEKEKQLFGRPVVPKPPAKSLPIKGGLTLAIDAISLYPNMA